MCIVVHRCCCTKRASSAHTGTLDVVIWCACHTHQTDFTDSVYQTSFAPQAFSVVILFHYFYTDIMCQTKMATDKHLGKNFFWAQS